MVFYFHECIECRTRKNSPIERDNVSPPPPFYENATHLNYRISINFKGPNSCFSIFVIIDAFSHFVVTNTAPQTSKYAIQTLLYHWITKFGPPQNFVTDRGTEYINQDMTCSLFSI